MTGPTVTEREALFRQLLRSSMERCGAKKGALYVLEPKANQHYLRCQEGFGSDDYIRYKIKKDDPAVTRLSEAGKPLLVNGPGDEPSLQDYLSESGASNMIVAPISARGVLIGIMDLRDKGKGAFKDGDGRVAAETTAQMAELVLTIPAIESAVPAPASSADPAHAMPGTPGADDGTLSTAVMKTIKKDGSAPPASPHAPEPPEAKPEAKPEQKPEAKESKAREERRKRPLLLPVELLREVMPILFRAIPIDYALVALCEEGILASYYVGIAPLPDARRKEMVDATQLALRRAACPGTDAEFVEDDFVILEPAAQPLEGSISHVAPFSVPLPRQGSEAKTMLVLAAIQIDRMGFSSDSADLLAQYGAVLKNLFLQRLRTLDYRQGYLSLLNQILKPIEKTVPYIKAHSIAVANYAKQMALRMALDEMHVENIMVASILHDVGLLDVEYEILRQKGSLSEKDLHEIRKHPVFSRDYVEQVTFPYPVAPLVYSHHERWDGKGYPEGLRGEAIPLGARVIAVAEAFDAMTSRHSYKAAIPPQAALEELKKNAGTQFDPRIIEVFVRIMQRPSRR